MLKTVLLCLAVGALPALAHAQGDFRMGLQSTIHFTVVPVISEQNPTPVPNTELTLSEIPSASEGGHMPGTHNPQRWPTFLGEISPNRCNSGPSGLSCAVSFTSKELGGMVRIRATYVHNGQPIELIMANRILISASGGDDYPSLVGRTPAMDYVGQTSRHPDNHYCRESFCQTLVQLANEYNATWSRIIAVNDNSLIKGGIFDISGSWFPPHNEHRVGASADIRANGGPNSIPFDNTIRQWFITRAIALFGQAPLHEEIGTPEEHFHIRG